MWTIGILREGRVYSTSYPGLLPLKKGKRLGNEVGFDLVQARICSVKPFHALGIFSWDVRMYDIFAPYNMQPLFVSPKVREFDFGQKS